MQASRGRRLHSTWRDAIFTSLGWQSIFFVSRPEMVSCPDQRRLLWPSRFYQGHVRTSRSALHWNGVRHGDDHQSQPAWRKNHRDSNHSTSRQTYLACATFENISGWLAHISLFFDVQSALAVSDPWWRLYCIWPAWL